MFVITGAGGNTGSKIAAKLLKAGKKVRIIARNQTKVQSLIDSGAECKIIDLNDSEALTAAFRGASGVYSMIPPDYTARDFRGYQNKIGDSIAKAIERAEVSHVINLSSIGAHMGYGSGVVLGLHDQEERLNAIDGVAVLNLRPGFFMENFFWQIDTIKTKGIMGAPQLANLPLPFIATADIADYAVQRFLKLDFTGKSNRELHGQRDLTMNECAAILGKSIGKPDLKYVEFPYEETRKAFVAMGMSEDAADKLIELQRGFNEGIVRATEPRSNANTTATSLEEFAGRFAAAFNSR